MKFTLKHLFGRSLMLCASLSLCSGALAKEKKNILFLAGNPSHGPGDHEFRAGCILLADKLNQSGLDVEAKVHWYGWPKDESIFDGVDACVVYADAGGRFGEKYDVLNKKVKEDGMGIMFMHYGVHPSKKVGEQYFKHWIGAYMDDIISVNPHWIADVNAVATEEVSRGIAPFTAYDEFYFNMQWPSKDDCDCCRPLAVATPTPDRVVKYINMWNTHGEKCFGTEQALMWCRDPKPDEGGRGVGFVGGHYHRNWAIDEFRKLVLNAIVWTARVEVPKDGVPAGTVTKEELNANLNKKRDMKVIELPTAELLKQKPMPLPWFDEQGKRHRGPKPAPVKTSATEKNNKPRVLAASRKITAKDETRHQALEADVTGLQSITLFADPLGSVAFDWINWVDVYFTDQAGHKIVVDASFITAEQQGWGELGKNVNAKGGPLMLSGKKYATGFGGHANSTIKIKVPKGAVKLSAVAGLDDGGALQQGGVTTADAQFKLINDEAQWAPKENPETVDLKYFSVPEGLEVTRWASSPMLFNPTNLDIDHKGRIWVAEGVNYRRKAGRRPDGDRIVVLEDTNGDGTADSSHTFVQEKGLECPLGVAVFDNKVVVPQPPDLLVYTDVNRDLKFDPAVDKREVLLTGFNARQHDHSLHSLTAGPDGKWYFNNGNCGAIFTDRSGKTFNMNGVYRGGGGTFYQPNNELQGKASDDGFVWTCGFGARMNPDGTQVEIFGHGYRNSYEQAVNSMGDVFQNDNDDYSGCRNSYVLEYGSAGFFTRDGQRGWRAEQRPGQPVQRAHWRQDDPGTFDAGDVYGLGSPTGVVYYENGALGDQWPGTYLASEAARNTVFGYQPKPKGATFDLSGRFDFITTNPSQEFIGGDFSKKIGRLSDARDSSVLFRPSDIAVGADGALYVADWYDGRVGGHGTIDTTCSGAIYRIAPKGFKPNIPALDLNTIAGQVDALKSPAVNVRYLGFTRLRDQKEKSYDAVAALVNHSNKYIASRAVWLLPHLGEQGLAKAKTLLQDSNPDRRLVAYRALRRAGVNILPFAAQLANDPNTAVRRDVALSLRHYSADETAAIFVGLAKDFDISDKNYVEAIGLGAENKEAAVWSALKKGLVSGGPSSWSDTFAKVTWRLWPVPAVADLKARAMSPELTKEQCELAVESLAFINHRSSADALLAIAGEKSQAAAQASYWLLKRGTGEWAYMDIRGQLKEKGIYDPSKIQVSAVTVPAPSTTSSLPSVQEVLALEGHAETGKGTIMRCIMCHNVNGAGANYGPALKGWGAAQSREAAVLSLLNPSADIAHGFKGKEIVLNDGTTVHGLVIEGDPLIVTSTGGITQMIPKGRVKQVKELGRSLMLSAEQLGLTGQDVADIVAYMKTWQ